jgi:hypothetical protein
MVYVHVGLSSSVNNWSSSPAGNTPEFSILKATVTGVAGVRDPEGSTVNDDTENADTT